METLNYLLIVPFGSLGVLFLLITLRRGLHLNDIFTKYTQVSETEVLRENFFTYLPLACGLFCIVPILVPTKLWYSAIPTYLIAAFVFACVVTIGNYLRAFMGNVLISVGTRRAIQDSGFWAQEPDPLASLAWYEFTPFTFIAGWIVYYLMYAVSAFVAKFDIASDNAPTWSILTALAVGALSATIATVNLYQTFKNAPKRT